MRFPAIPTVLLVAAFWLGGCPPPQEVATETMRLPGDHGHKTMADAWLTFLWACQRRDAARIRTCLTGRALKAFETVAKKDEPAAVEALHSTFVDTDIVINLDHFDTRVANGLKILERESGRVIQIGAVRMDNAEPNSLKLPHYLISRFDWDR